MHYLCCIYDSPEPKDSGETGRELDRSRWRKDREILSDPNEFLHVLYPALIANSEGHKLRDLIAIIIARPPTYGGRLKITKLIGAELRMQAPEDT